MIAAEFLLVAIRATPDLQQRSGKPKFLDNVGDGTITRLYPPKRVKPVFLAECTTIFSFHDTSRPVFSGSGCVSGKPV